MAAVSLARNLFSQMTLTTIVLERGWKEAALGINSFRKKQSMDSGKAFFDRSKKLRNSRAIEDKIGKKTIVIRHGLEEWPWVSDLTIRDDHNSTRYSDIKLPMDSFNIQGYTIL